MRLFPIPYFLQMYTFNFVFCIFSVFIQLVNNRNDHLITALANILYNMNDHNLLKIDHFETTCFLDRSLILKKLLAFRA